MATIYIDDIAYEVPNGKNLLEVALSLGLDLTYFCWHPAMHSVGACRQCAVLSFRDENDKNGRIVMACMQDANDGMRFSINGKKAHDFRAGNIESLMINHPHDCPVCDEGGECHLQDMTVMSGHNYRRYRFNKRTHNNQYLGPFINHEMNRCIQCYRCVRFYNDYAGGQDFGVFASNGRVYFGRSEDGILENEFSGNLVEVCPTGVFTDKTLRQHYTRKWDLTSAPSICHQCSLGCNTLASERYGGLRRIMSRFNGDVNGYFICDRGRFGYEYVNSESRLTRCAQKDGTMEAAFENIQKYFATRPRMIGIGSPRASLESNFMLKKLVGEENFFRGIPSNEGKCVDAVLKMLTTSGVTTPSLAEVEKFDTVFVLGEDVTNTAPMMALALRQAAKNIPRQKAFDLRIQHWNDAAIREVVQGETGPFYIATPYATKLDEIATSSYFGDTNSLLKLAKLIHQKIQTGATQQTGDGAMESFASQVSGALLASKKPLIVSGTGMTSESVIYAAASIAAALKSAGKDAGLTYTVPYANSLGLAMIGGRYIEDAMTEIKKSSQPDAIVLETNLFRQFGSNDAIDFLDHCGKVTLLDSLENETTSFADYILPAGTFAESDGTFVNNEGRAQRYYQVHVPKFDIRSSWAWLDMMLHQSEQPRPFDAIVADLVESNPIFDPIKFLAPTADFRIGTQKIPRASHRFSGRTAMNANISVHEPKPPIDSDSPLSFTMEGYHGQPPSADTPFFWSPGWNSVQSINKYQIEVGGPLHGGNPGKRLIEASENGSIPLMNDESGVASGNYLVMPAYHIYGSDELSALSPPLAQRIPPATISISESALAKSGHSGAETISIQYHDENISLPVHINNSLPENVLLIPYGFKETQGIRFPFETKIV